MLFDSALFVWFLGVTWVVQRGLRGHETLRLLWLLVTSYAFYASWNVELLSLIVFSTVTDWFLAGRIAASTSPRVRKLWLLASLITNLGLLAVFKYTGFLLESVRDGAELAGVALAVPEVDILLPVGISFYTFQTLSYTIDVYRGTLQPERSLLRFSLFVVFFPQLVAGPIVRAADFLPQLRSLPEVTDAMFGRGLALILLGLVKKVAVANWLAVNFVDRVFENPTMYSSLETLVGVWGYAVQIYCDFSGYSDVAIGAALLLGFTLPPNFDRPYASADLQEFWRRWHISLSTWLRDYLYIPLGGNRSGAFETYRNLLITMLLGGLWHGPSWNFVIWGALHGGALGVNRALQRRRPVEAASGSVWRRWAGVVITFHFTCFCWVFFRAPDLDSALGLLSNLALGTAWTPNLTPAVWTAIALPLSWHMTPTHWRETAIERFIALPVVMQAVVAVAVAAALQWIAGTDVVPFIYFQF